MSEPTPHDHATNNQVWQEQLRILHSNQLVTFLGSWLTALFLFFLYRQTVPAMPLNSWLVLATAVAVGRIVFWYFFRFAKFTALDFATKNYIVSSLVGSYASGAIWAIFVLFICIFPVPDLLRITLLFILVGLGASGIFALASVWHVYMGFFATAYIPVVLGFGWLAWQNASQWYALVALLSLLYLIINTRFAWRYHTTLVESIRLRFTNQELTIKVQMERDLAHAARLAQESFIVNISHDLRQPMQALSVFASVLNKEHAKSNASPAARELGEMIQQSSFMLSAQVEHLLDLRRALQERLPKIELINLARLLERIAQEMKFMASQRDLDFRWRKPLGDEGQWVVLTDPLLFERVIRNLLDNAFKYTHKGGVLLALRRQADVICVEVIDTGLGMDTELVSLNPMHPDGFGFGLNIVNRICQRLDHQFSARSRIGQGTLCSLRVRCFASQPPEPNRSVLSNLSTPHHHIYEGSNPPKWGNLWLLDDDPLALKALGILAQPMASNMHHFQSAQEFEDAMGHSDCPDAVMVDWQLGFASARTSHRHSQHDGLSGQITSKHLILNLREEYNRDVPVCVVSANISHAIQELSTLGKIVFLKKPVSSDDLATAFLQLHQMD